MTNVARVTTPPPQADALALARELAALPKETDWAEFKQDNQDPDMIGEYVSALSNSAALAGKARGYLVWGVRDADHQIVGCTFDPFAAKVGNEDLVNWLQHLVSPQMFVQFRVGADEDGRRVVVLEVEAANDRPVAFKGVEFVRVGSHKKRLKEHTNHERRLWRTFETTSFETGLAAQGLPEEGVTSLFDYPEYFHLLGLPLPENRQAILQALLAEKLVTVTEGSGWAVTNLGALLFARKLTDFPGLARKAPRIVQYKGNARLNTVKEQVGVRGYASAFKGLVGYLNGLFPDNEIVGQALRQSAPLYPELAIRELVANALVHQDLSIGGTGPMVEVFADRIEITNPGTPLIEPSRFIDSPPQSRNETTASLMRRIGVCEERGSGWDKVAFEIEFHQLPPPLVEVTDNHTRVTLFAPRSLTKMNKVDRIRAVYQHACLKYVSNQDMNNSTVRQRFAIEDQNKANASRLIREALDAGAIVAYDTEAGPRAIRYVPFWAGL